MLTRKQQELLRFIEARLTPTACRPLRGNEGGADLNQIGHSPADHGPGGTRTIRRAPGAGAGGGETGRSGRQFDPQFGALPTRRCRCAPASPQRDPRKFPPVGAPGTGCITKIWSSAVLAGSPGTLIEALRGHSDHVEAPATSPAASIRALVAGDRWSRPASMMATGDHPALRQRRERQYRGGFGGRGRGDQRLRRKGASVALEPANAAYETRIFGPDRVRVQGRLVALMRQY